MKLELSLFQFKFKNNVKFADKMFCTGMNSVFLSALFAIVSGCATDNSADIARNSLRSQDVPFSAKAFTKAASEGKNNIVDLFIAGGMDININDDETPLISAVVNNQKGMVEFLLQKKADPNVHSYLGSPLLLSSKSGFYDISKMLLQAGADIDYKMSSGMTPLLEAVKNDHLEVAELLIKNGAEADEGDSLYNRTPLYFAASNGNADMINLLCENDADMNDPDVNGNTPIYCAVVNKHSEIVSLLMDKGVKLSDSKNNVCRAVLEACSRNSDQILNTMIAKGLDVNCLAPEGIPLLSWCIKNRYFDSAKILLAAKAGIDVQDREGETVYDYVLNSDKDFIAYFKSVIQKSAPVETLENTKKEPVQSE